MMKGVLAVLLVVACAAEKEPVQQAPAPAPVQTATSHDDTPGTWSGQVKVDQPISTFNYVGAESGDWAPMRFRNDSEAGRKILAVCGDDDLCEFTGVVRWLDEAPPPDASAVGEIVSVERVRRVEE
jgi:hypothetical protein